MHLTRFRLVEKQSATVRTHTCALSWTSPFKIKLITFKTLNGSGPRYLEDILKFYHQSRTSRSSRDHLRLEEPNFNIKTYGQRAFLLSPDYRISSPLKFELVLMLIFLNLSWKRFFLKRYRYIFKRYSFIIFVFVFFPF